MQLPLRRAPPALLPTPLPHRHPPAIPPAAPLAVLLVVVLAARMRVGAHEQALDEWRSFAVLALTIAVLLGSEELAEGGWHGTRRRGGAGPPLVCCRLPLGVPRRAGPARRLPHPTAPVGLQPAGHRSQALHRHRAAV